MCFKNIRKHTFLTVEVRHLNRVTEGFQKCCLDMFLFLSYNKWSHSLVSYRFLQLGFYHGWESVGLKKDVLGWYTPLLAVCYLDTWPLLSTMLAYKESCSTSSHYHYKLLKYLNGFALFMILRLLNINTLSFYIRVVLSNLDIEFNFT